MRIAILSDRREPKDLSSTLPTFKAPASHPANPPQSLPAVSCKLSAVDFLPPPRITSHESRVASGLFPRLISFVCHSYEKCRGVPQFFPFWNATLSLQRPHRSLPLPPAPCPPDPFPLTPLLATHPKNVRVSSIIATDPKSSDPKPFACHTSETPRGVRLPALFPAGRKLGTTYPAGKKQEAGLEGRRYEERKPRVFPVQDTGTHKSRKTRHHRLETGNSKHEIRGRRAGLGRPPHSKAKMPG
jgi:hypothetical protein